ncbi:hypothetical protein [Rhizobium sp. SSA_523]|uniref:hypothetical protein n=1 Tax=Rhizobium sp. SSA_523 TaxID=2952477 RepID=UPI002091B83D|nr:hypothetical protein [Rhizobium sp. SSA_523]MCO5730528.1 hypothetical protein [Rhizobium sp. SSA_523]WKC25567.1 hypothetical protein QTJ18_16540 [Rhizobium sp. SSA_523]
MDGLSAFDPRRWMRIMMVAVGGEEGWQGHRRSSRINRVDAEAMPDRLKEDIGLAEGRHDRRRQSRPSAFDAAREIALRRPL